LNALDIARDELIRQSAALKVAAERLGPEIDQAVDLLYACEGNVVVTGMGKTGLVGRKISATLSSTGTPSIYLHPAEGIHGDLGMVSAKDVVIAVSSSGNTPELVSILPYFRFLKVPVIALTGNLGSKLAEAASVTLDCSVPTDSEPFGLVPTSSTTLALAMGDALAVALIEKRDFKVTDFARFHPGGTIGKKILLRVRDLMHQGSGNPVVLRTAHMDKTIMVMTTKGLGCTNVIDEAGKLVGIVTDGDLRRLLSRGDNALQHTAEEAMTVSPKRLLPETLAVDALNLMEQYKITMLPVVDEDSRPIGLLHMHDLITAGVVG
jgi:arabinose-5-phosphate isomerase